MAGGDTHLIVNFTDRAVAQFAVREDDLTAFLNRRKSVRRDDFIAEGRIGCLHGVQCPGDRDGVAQFDDGSVVEVDCLAAAPDAFDRGVGELLVELHRGLADGLVIPGDLVDPGNDVVHRVELPRLECRVATGELFFELDRLLADVPPHDQRQEPGHHDDRAERAEDVTNRVSDGDVGLHGFRYVRRQAEFGDGIAGGAENRRLRQAAGGESGRHAAVEPEHPGGGEDAKQAREAHDEGGDQLIERTQIKRVKELRSTLESDRVNKQREEDRADARIDFHADLTDDDADQQRASDAAQNECSNLQFADEIAKGNGDEQRDQGLLSEQMPGKVHCCVSGSSREIRRRTGIRRDGQVAVCAHRGCHDLVRRGRLWKLLTPGQCSRAVSGPPRDSRRKAGGRRATRCLTWPRSRRSVDSTSSLVALASIRSCPDTHLQGAGRRVRLSGLHVRADVFGEDRPGPAGPTAVEEEHPAHG